MDAGRARRKLFLLHTFMFSTLASLAVAPAASGDSWTRFRGPNGSGVSTTSSLPTKWSEDDYRWKVKLPGKGHSSPVVWGDRIFVTSGDEETGRRIVACLNPAGRLLWSKSFEASKHGKHSLNSFASATPAVDAERLYVCWASPEQFVVVALNHAGDEVWRRQLGECKTGHGFAVSPIVHQNLLVVPNDHEGQSFVAALDTKTGDTRWRIERDSKVTYATPCVFKPAGRPAELIFTNWKYGIQGINPTNGNTNWQAKVFSQDSTETSIGSPVVAGDLVIGCAGWLTRERRIVAVRPKAAAGAIQVEQAYAFERRMPLSTTPLMVGDRMYLWSDEGIVSCVDSQSGKVFWQKRVGGTFYGSPVYAGGHVYCLSADGECVVLEAADNYRLVAKNALGDGSHSTPAIADGRMYLRTFSHLMALGRPK